MIRVVKTQWREKVTKTYLDLVPLVDHFCAVCLSKKRLTAHHIRERKHGGDDDYANLLVLCKFCHDSIHATDDLVIKEIYDNAVTMKRLTSRNAVLRTKLKKRNI